MQQNQAILEEQLKQTKAELGKESETLKQMTTQAATTLATMEQLQVQMSAKDKRIEELTGEVEKAQAKDAQATEQEFAEPTSPKSRKKAKDKMISSRTLKVFCENLQKALDPRLVFRLSEIYNINFSKPEQSKTINFEDASFDYTDVCVACAHSVSIVLDFIQWIIQPESKSPFSNMNEPDFYDSVMQTGQESWKTSTYLKSILFSTRLGLNRKIDTEWTSGAWATSSWKKGFSDSKSPIEIWALGSPPLHYVKGKAKLKKYDNRLKKGPEGIFGRLITKQNQLPLQSQKQNGNILQLGLEMSQIQRGEI